MPHPILLYDGVCGLCNRLVQFVLRRDPEGVFRFAALQSGLAERILARHGADARDLDSVYVVVNCDQGDERVLARSDAVIFILRRLGADVPTQATAADEQGAAKTGRAKAPVSTRAAAVPTQAKARSKSGLMFWRVVGVLLRFIPRPLRDLGYGIVARYRYRIFGRYDSCPIPSAETRSRFLSE
jgi:predicted DCC family thiol-disulfide oxidoreductase YuxK